MAATLAFDVYGTLIDTQGVVAELSSMFAGNDEQALAFSTHWREKQLEYSFRRGLMQHYANFATCTRDALNYTDLRYQTALRDAQKQRLMDCYATLPAFSDVAAGLQALKAAGHPLYAFSNGSADAVEALLQQAGIRDLFLDVISVEALCSYKPNPAVYAHFMRTTGAAGNECWLISSNPFDVIGAISAGMHSAWVQRSPQAIFDPWGINPSATVTSLTALSEALARHG